MANTVTSSREAVEMAVTRFFHMCNTHCPGNLAPMLASDVTLLADQESTGSDSVHGYFVWLWQSYPEMTFRVEHILIDGSMAAAEVSYTQGPGGKGARCMTFQFRGDKIRRIRCY